jgi:hypothetical protein
MAQKLANRGRADCPWCYAAAGLIFFLLVLSGKALPWHHLQVSRTPKNLAYSQFLWLEIAHQHQVIKRLQD